MDVRTMASSLRRAWRELWIVLAAVALASVASVGAACEQEGPAEEAGESIDEAAEDVGDAVDDAGS